jgi:hypothetical protein
MEGHGFRLYSEPTAGSEAVVRQGRIDKLQAEQVIET